jgi:hypothetical protein
MRRKILLGALVMLGSLPLAPGAGADPATLHIGTPAGTACAQGCGGDPNVITGNVLSVFQNSGGAPDLLSPLLLIVGVPNGGAAPTISSVQEFDPYTGSASGGSPVASFSLGGANLYGGVWDVASGFGGTWDSGDPQVYEFLGFEPPNTNASNNFGNWSDASVADAGVIADDYDLYVYRINATLGDKGLFEIMWLSAPAAGSIAIAYGCAELGTDGRCAGSGDVYTTPFTEVGLFGGGGNGGGGGTQQIPEPGTLTLLGSGLIGLAAAGVWARRRKSS